MTAELKRYECSETGGGEMIEYPHGDYVRFADVEACTQAAIAAAMLAAVKPLEWDHDGRRLRMEFTMEFSKGYDWDAYETMRQEGYGLAHAYIIWPDTYGSKHWNVYGVFDGLYIHNCDGEDAAKAAAQADYQARILSALSIPADATAALEAVKAAVRNDIAAWLDTLPADATPSGAAILLRKGGE